MADDQKLKVMNKEAAISCLSATDGVTHVDLDLDADSQTNFWKKEDGPISMAFAAQEYDMTFEGLEDVARLVGLPKGYVQRCLWHLLEEHLKYWYSGGLKAKARLFVQDQQIVGVGTSRSDYFSNMEMLEHVEEAVGVSQILGYHQVFTGLDYSTAAVVLDQKFEPRVGDALYGGIRMQNSILGEHKIEITPYVFRQWCSNGAIVSENIAQWSRRSNDGSDLRSWVLDNTQSAVNALDNEFSRIRKLADSKLEGSVDQTLASLFRKFGIPVRTQQQIVEAAEASNDGKGPETAYDLWNAITVTATHSDSLSRPAARMLMGVAGEVSQQYSVCPSCHQICNH